MLTAAHARNVLFERRCEEENTILTAAHARNIFFERRCGEEKLSRVNSFSPQLSPDGGAAHAVLLSFTFFPQHLLRDTMRGRNTMLTAANARNVLFERRCEEEKAAGIRLFVPQQELRFPPEAHEEDAAK